MSYSILEIEDTSVLADLEHNINTKNWTEKSLEIILLYIKLYFNDTEINEVDEIHDKYIMWNSISDKKKINLLDIGIVIMSKEGLKIVKKPKHDVYLIISKK